MTEVIRLREDYIRPGQTLKVADLVQPGVNVKYAIEDDLVSVNGKAAFQRGEELVDGDIVTYDG